MSEPCSCPIAGYCPRHKMEKTPNLHALCQTREDYRQFFDQQVGIEPGLAQKAGSFLKSSVKWVAGGLAQRPQAEVDRIFDTICTPCAEFVDKGDSRGSCKVCGCRLSRLGGLVNKIGRASESCPIGKWGTWSE